MLHSLERAPALSKLQFKLALCILCLNRAGSLASAEAIVKLDQQIVCRKATYSSMLCHPLL